MNLKIIACPVRVILAFVAAILVYCVGYFVGVFAGDVHAIITLVLPSSIPVEDFWAAFASLIANIGSFAVFVMIFPKIKVKRSALFIWVTILLILAIVYTVLCFYASQEYLLAYPAACVIPIVVMYVIVAKCEYEESEKTITT